MFVWAGGRRDRILFKNPSRLILEPEEVPADVDEVWYADCCPPDLTDPAAGRPFRVFDHHVSNMRKHGLDPRCTFDMARSGTSLMADVLGLDVDDDQKGDVFSQLVSSLEAYDLGRFDDAAGVRLADLAATFSQEQMLEVMLEREPEGILYDSDLTARTEAASAIRDQYVASASNFALIESMSLPGAQRLVTIAIAAAPVYWKNALAQELLKKAEVAVIVDIMGGMVSLRSMPGGPDCSMIAAAYGGGGHARAAGFKCDTRRTLELLLEGVFG